MKIHIYKSSLLQVNFYCIHILSFKPSKTKLSLSGFLNQGLKYFVKDFFNLIFFFSFFSPTEQLKSIAFPLELSKTAP